MRPYAYLVALSKKPSNSELRAASAISAPKWSWFSYIALVLLESFSSVLTQEISAPKYTMRPPFSIQSKTPAKAIIFTG